MYVLCTVREAPTMLIVRIRDVETKKISVIKIASTQNLPETTSEKVDCIKLWLHLAKRKGSGQIDYFLREEEL